MDFVRSLGDCSNVPEFAVGGVGRAEIIDNCIVRLTLYKPGGDHGDQHTPVCELVWTIPAWVAARAPIAKLAAEIALAVADAPACPVSDVSLRHH